MTKEGYVSNKEIKRVLDEVVSQFRYLKSSVESLEKRIEGVRDRDRTIENLNMEVVGLRCRLDATTPILEVLLHDRVKPGFKQRVSGQGHIPNMVAPADQDQRLWP